MAALSLKRAAVSLCLPPKPNSLPPAKPGKRLSIFVNPSKILIINSKTQLTMMMIAFIMITLGEIM